MIKKPKKRSRYVPFEGSKLQGMLRYLIDEKPLTESELYEILKRGNGVFWKLKRESNGRLLIFVFSEAQVARRLGVKLTAESRQIPVTVLRSQKEFEAALAGLRNG